MRHYYRERYGQPELRKRVKWWKYPLFWLGFKKAKRIRR